MKKGAESETIQEQKESTEEFLGEMEKQEVEEKKEERIPEMEEKTDDYLEMLQRLQAEFENYKKRVEKEQILFCEQANAQLVSKLLPVLDNFGRALSCKTDQESFDSFKKGMEMIFSQLVNILESEGLSRIEAEGIEFDPYYHECVLTEKGDYEDDTVIQELEKGYLFRNKVLRPSKVKVGKRGD